MNSRRESVIELEAGAEESPSLPFQQLLTASVAPVASTGKTRVSFSGTLVGQFIGISEAGVPFVEFSGNLAGQPVAARSIVPVALKDVGREAVLVFEGGDAARPILVGLLQPAVPPDRESTVEARLDGEQLTLTAKNEIVLRCGKASLTLTRAGKVIIRGAYLLSRSSGVNRIKGGSVQIN